MRKENKEVWTEKYVLWYIEEKIRCLKTLKFFLFLNLFSYIKNYSRFLVLYECLEMFIDKERHMSKGYSVTLIKKLNFSALPLVPGDSTIVQILITNASISYSEATCIQYLHIPSPIFLTHTHTHTHTHTVFFKYYSYILNFPI